MLWKRQGGRCAACSVLMDGRATRPPLTNMATRDHIVPRSRGGAHSSTNIQLLCYVCNTTKSDMDDALFKSGYRTPTRPPKKRKTKRQAGASFRKVKEVRYQPVPA